MASYYVRSSDGDNANPGTPAEPKQNLFGAFAEMSPGDVVYVSNSHSFTYASQTLTIPGIADNLCGCICIADWGAETDPGDIDHSSSYGGAENSGSGSGNSLRLEGYGFFIGMIFRGGVGATSSTSNLRLRSSSAYLIFKECLLVQATTSANARIQIGDVGSSAAANRVELYDTDVSFANAGQGLSIAQASLRWDGGGIASGSVRPNLFFDTGTNSGDVAITGVDLSLIDSGATAIAEVNGEVNTFFRFKNCKLGEGVVYTTSNQFSQAGIIFEAIDCGPGSAKSYFSERYQGKIYHETGIIRSGGADDGHSPFSRRIVSSSHTCFMSPLTLGELVFNNESLEPVTVTVHCVNDGLTLQNNELWLTAEYLDSASILTVSSVSSAMAELSSTPQDLPSSTESWATTGMTNAVGQKMSATFTPAQAGLVRVSVSLARPDTTVYVCPKVEIS